MFKTVHYVYRGIVQQARLRISRPQQGRPGSYSSRKELLSQILNFVRRYEAKSFVSTQNISEQKLQILAREFKAIFLVDRRAKERPEAKKKPLSLKKRLIKGKANRCYELNTTDIGRVLEQLHSPAVVWLSQEPGLDKQLAAISRSTQRYPLIINLVEEAQGNDFESLLQMSKSFLTGYYFDHDEHRLYCHPY